MSSCSSRSGGGPTPTTSSGPRSARRSGSSRGSRSRTARSPSSSRGSSTTRATSPTRTASIGCPPGSTRSTRSAARRGNRLFYLATQPSAFAEIIGQLGRVGLDHETHGGGWRRLIIEKPFGRDLESAVRLNREVGKVFRERAGLPDRPLPGQGDGPQPARLPLRQRHLRAALEPALRGPRADHGGRVDRGREPRRLLRGDRGEPGRPPEPPHAAAQPGRDGAAGDVRGGGPPRREGQGPPGDRADRS